MGKLSADKKSTFWATGEIPIGRYGMKQARKVTRCMVLGLVCLGGTAPIWNASGARSRSTSPIQASILLSSVHGDSRNSRLQTPRSAKLSSSDLPSRARITQLYKKLPLSFEPNRGQADPRVKFLARGREYALFLTSDEAVFKLKKPAASADQPKPVGGSKLALLRSKFVEGWRRRAADDVQLAKHSLVPPLLQAPKPQVANVRLSAPSGQDLSPDTLRMRLLGANPSPRVTGLQELPGKSNYLFGRDPGKWRTHVPNYAKVKYESVYPGVNLVYYGSQGQLEYDFVIAPGADPETVRLEFQGAKKINVDEHGELVVDMGSGHVRFHKPVVYQPAETGKSSVAHNQPPSATGNVPWTDHVNGGFVMETNNEVRFRISSYDPGRPLIIDPVLEYSTYLGGSGDDLLAPAGTQGIAVDSEGNAYVIGATDSIDFPTTSGTFQTKFAGGTGVFGCFFGIAADAFVTKLNAKGDAIVYSTYLGGSDDDCGEGIAVDSAGNAYVAGETLSTDFPVTKGAFQPVCASCSNGLVDTFAAKLSPDGSGLTYSTYTGGNNDDLFPMIVIDRGGNMYIEGSTFSTDYPTTPAAFQPACASCANGAPDTYVTKLNPAGTRLVYSTYLGGATLSFVEHKWRLIVAETHTSTASPAPLTFLHTIPSRRLPALRCLPDEAQSGGQ